MVVALNVRFNEHSHEDQAIPAEEQSHRVGDYKATSPEMNQVVPDLEQDALVVEQVELPTLEQVEDPASIDQPPEGGEASMTIEPTL